MNIDRRRIIAPEGITPIYPKTSSQQSKDDNDIKKMFIKTGLINNANGSSYMEIDNNIIEVSVFGPRPIRGSFIDQALVSVECKFLPHVSQPNEGIFNENDGKKHGLTNIEQKISSYVETAILPSILLKKYPKSTIDLHITIIENNTSLLNLIGWIINCSSIALVDAGIEIKDIITSGQVNLKTVDGNESVIVDPNDNDNSLEVLVSYMNLKNDEIVGLWIEGSNDLDNEVLNGLITKCNEMSRKIRSNINAYLLSQQ